MTTWCAGWPIRPVHCGLDEVIGQGQPVVYATVGCGSVDSKATKSQLSLLYSLWFDGARSRTLALKKVH